MHRGIIYGRGKKGAKDSQHLQSFNSGNYYPWGDYLKGGLCMGGLFMAGEKKGQKAANTYGLLIAAINILQ